MVIEISDSKTVGDIQFEFSNRYPHLKLEFFSVAHAREENSLETPYGPEIVLGEIRERHVHGTISLTPERETGSVEQEFEDRFGLHVQIYRMQSGEWLQTVGTDILTLREQIEIAQSGHFNYNFDHEMNEDNF